MSNYKQIEMKIIKNMILVCVCLTVVGSSILNIVSQLSILNEARQKNTDLSNKLDIVEKENMMLKNRITYATTSSFLEQQSRDKLGLGSENDYWIRMPEENKELDLYPRINEVDNKQTAKQWINLFTQ